MSTEQNEQLCWQIANRLQMLVEGLKNGFALDSPLDSLLEAQIDIAQLISDLAEDGLTLRSIPDEVVIKPHPEPLYTNVPIYLTDKSRSVLRSLVWKKVWINKPSSPLVYNVDSDHPVVGNMRDSSIVKFSRRRKMMSENFLAFEDAIIDYSVQWLVHPEEVGKEFVHPSQNLHEATQKSQKLTNNEYHYWKRAQRKRSRKYQKD